MLRVLVRGSLEVRTYNVAALKNYLPPSRGVSAAAITVTVAGLLLVGAAVWLRPFAPPNGPLQGGISNGPPSSTPSGAIGSIGSLTGKTSFPGLDDLVMGNQLSLQYTLRRYDRILEDRRGAGNETIRGPAVVLGRVRPLRQGAR